MSTQTKRTCEDTVRTWPPANQGERPQEKTTLPLPYLGLPASRTVRK